MEGCDTLSSGHGKTMTMMTSQQLGLLPIDLHKMGPIISQFMDQGGVQGILPLPSELLAIDGCSHGVGGSLTSIEYPQVNLPGSSRHFQTYGHTYGSG